MTRPEFKVGDEFQCDEHKVIIIGLAPGHAIVYYEVHTPGKDVRTDARYRLAFIEGLMEYGL